MSISIPTSKSIINISVMNENVRNTLDALLKFGSVFLIYRFFSYYFFDRNTNTPFFEGESLRLVILILIGFSVYYLFVHPHIPINLRNPVLNNVANDSLMFGTVLVTSHILESYMTGDEYFNQEWLTTAGIILLAFATYRVLVQPFIPLRNMNPTVVPLVSDLAQFGTFLIAFRIMQGKSLCDQKWIMSVLFVLLGFTGYHVVTKKIISVT